jgi:hypothetical protein
LAAVAPADWALLDLPLLFGDLMADLGQSTGEDAKI